MNIQTHEKSVIYLPKLPNLSSDDLTLYRQIRAARADLVARLSDAGMFVDNVDGANSWVKNMLHYAEVSDAFLFPTMTALPETHTNFKAEAAQRWFEFFSVVTGVHIGNLEKYGRDGYSKPCVLVDPDGQWESVISLLEDLRAKGMFTSRVEDIVQRVPNIAAGDDDSTINQKAVSTLQYVTAEGKRKARKDVKTLYPHDYVFQPFRKDTDRHPFGIALFGSASTREESYLRQVAQTTRLAAQRGWRMVSGAGKDGCMGAADKGFEQGTREFLAQYPNARFKPAHVGVSTQSILRLEGPPEHLDQLIITNDIYDRIRVMVRGQKSSNPMQRTRDAAKVMFIAPGGTGTLHELATLMQLATNGESMMDRRAVLLNFPSHLNPQAGFWDALIATSKKLGFADMLDIAHTPEEALSLADKVYKEWLERHPEFRDLPHPKA